MVYRKRKLTAPELKYTEPVSSIQEYRVGETIYGSPTTDAHVLDNQSQRSFFNKWWSFAPPAIYVPTTPGFPPTVGLQRSSTPFFSNKAFEESVFVPGKAGVGGIKQGTGAHDRIGRSVAVMKDTWRWTVSIPNKHSFQDTNGQYAHANFGYGGRPFRVRMLCLFRRTLDTPGDFVFRTDSVFDDVKAIDTTFKADTNGYTVICDKRFTLGSIGSSVYTVPSHYKSYADRTLGGLLSFSFKQSMPRYELQWADDNSTGRFTPETQYDLGMGATSESSPGDITMNGVTKGTFQWFCFVEDEFADVISGSSTIDTTAKPWDGPNVPAGGINFQVERNVKYIDP